MQWYVQESWVYQGQIKRLSGKKSKNLQPDILFQLNTIVQFNLMSRFVVKISSLPLHTFRVMGRRHLRRYRSSCNIARNGYLCYWDATPIHIMRYGETLTLEVSSVVKNIVVDRRLTSTFLISIAERYAHSKTWRFRHTFALLCSVLLKEQAMGSEDFASILWPHLLDLSWDPIPNVRILVAKCIVENLVIDEYFIQEHLESLKSVLRRLQADNDGDVRFSASCSSV